MKKDTRKVFIGGIATGLLIAGILDLLIKGVMWIVWANQFINTNLH